MTTVDKVAVAVLLGALFVGACAIDATITIKREPLLAGQRKSYRAAVDESAQYRRLPVCAPGVKPPCSDAQELATLHQAETAAANSLDVAEAADAGGAGTPEPVRQKAAAAAVAAVAVLHAIVRKLKRR